MRVGRVSENLKPQRARRATGEFGIPRVGGISSALIVAVRRRHDSRRHGRESGLDFGVGARLGVVTRLGVFVPAGLIVDEAAVAALALLIFFDAFEELKSAEVGPQGL